MQPIILYDIPSRVGKAWNTSVLRARFSLGFKGLSYKTEWVEYPQIESTLKNIGAAPTGTRPDTGGPFYTVPVIVDPNNVGEEGKPAVVSESHNIALYLDEHYPTKNQLIPKGTNGLQALFAEYLLQNAVYPVIGNFPLRFHNILNEESQPYFRGTREGFFKRKLEDINPEGSEEREQAWEGSRLGLSKLASLLKDEKNEGPFLTGSSPCFIDFVTAAVLEMFVCFTPEDWEKKVIHWDDGKWKAHRDACVRFLESSDVKTV